MPPRRISLSELNRQNIVYSDAEQIVLKNELKTTKASLLRLSTLRSNGEDGRQRQLKDKIQRYQVALAPFKMIPKEIWMYIFELYCQSGKLSTCDMREPPSVALTQVCSAWRQIVLTMPKLWSDVYLGNDDNLRIARVWFERAGDIPRALESSPPCHPRPYKRPQTIQSFICSFSFRKLHITQCDAAGIDFTAIPVESLLLLEDLALLKPAPNSKIFGATFSPHQFPNLVSLQIDTDIMPRFHASPFATWKKLRILRLKCTLTKSQCLEILRDSSVEDCSLFISLYDRCLTIENTVVANLKILSLSFSFIPRFWSLHFLDHFTFPNLHTLILTSQGSINYFRSSDRPPLLRLAPRIRSLRSLNIRHFCLNVDVGFILECLPWLQVLELHCDKITTHTAEKIGRGELGAYLRELCNSSWSSNNLYEFLLACELRRDVTQGQSPNSLEAIARLEKVSVMWYSNSVVSCKQRIRKLREDGIEFEVVQPSTCTSTIYY